MAYRSTRLEELLLFRVGREILHVDLQQRVLPQFVFQWLLVPLVDSSGIFGFLIKKGRSSERRRSSMMSWSILPILLRPQDTQLAAGGTGPLQHWVKKHAVLIGDGFLSKAVPFESLFWLFTQHLPTPLRKASLPRRVAVGCPRHRLYSCFFGMAEFPMSIEKMKRRISVAYPIHYICSTSLTFCFNREKTLLVLLGLKPKEGSNKLTSLLKLYYVSMCSMYTPGAAFQPEHEERPNTIFNTIFVRILKVFEYVKNTTSSHFNHLLNPPRL